MATSWKSQQSNGEFALQFETDSKEKYKLVEKAAQMAVDGKTTADVVEVVRCKDCELSSKPKSVSRYKLYCNNYDVRFCDKEQKIVCGTHSCGYGTPKERGGEK